MIKWKKQAPVGLLRICNNWVDKKTTHFAKEEGKTSRLSKDKQRQNCSLANALTAFTLSNARRFYSSMGNPLAGKGLSGSGLTSNVRMFYIACHRSIYLTLIHEKVMYLKWRLKGSLKRVIVAVFNFNYVATRKAWKIQSWTGCSRSDFRRYYLSNVKSCEGHTLQTS